MTPLPDLAARASPAELRRQADAVSGQLAADSLSSAPPALMMILNRQRQIVYSNPAVLRILNLPDPSLLCGLRPGEALHCSRATSAPSGCGTTPFCQTCGAFRAILSAQLGRPDMQECRISSTSGEALDLRVWSTPVTFHSEPYVLLSILDVGDEKRRRALERIFFHDIMNAAVGLRGLSDLMSKAPPDEANRFRSMLHDLAGKLIEDIQAQRDLANAEHHELVVKPAPLRSSSLVAEVLALFHGVALSHGVSLASPDTSADVPFSSDPVLLRRILGNLVKNAIEASRPGDAVRLSCLPEDRHVSFLVHNPAVIPPDVQLQLFQRSFSTKGDGRGLGTYSIKLLTESYLQGSVAFSSSAPHGTLFTVRFPLALEAPAPRPPPYSS